jgi:hypothetical protein
VRGGRHGGLVGHPEEILSSIQHHDVRDQSHAKRVSQIGLFPPSPVANMGSSYVQVRNLSETRLPSLCHCDCKPSAFIVLARHPVNIRCLSETGAQELYFVMSVTPACARRFAFRLGALPEQVCEVTVNSILFDSALPDCELTTKRERANLPLITVSYLRTSNLSAPRPGYSPIGAAFPETLYNGVRKRSEHDRTVQVIMRLCSQCTCEAKRSVA